MNPLVTRALINKKYMAVIAKIQYTDLICNPKFFLVSLQQVPVVKNHVVLEEEKSISTTISFKNLGQIPDEMLKKKGFQVRLADMAVLYNPENRIQQTIDSLYATAYIPNPLLSHIGSAHMSMTL
jgi:hypothetical protein